MPTIWKAEEIYKSIEQFKRVKDKNVELIIVDNTHSDFYDSDPRITVVKCSKNIFVNPAWNIGARLARNKYICLLNDDIYFNYIPLINSFPQFIESYPNLGLIGFNDQTLKIDGELNDDNDKLDDFKKSIDGSDGMELLNFPPVSINCCSWTGSGMKEYTEKLGDVWQDESWLSVYLPIIMGKPNYIYFNCSFCNF